VEVSVTAGPRDDHLKSSSDDLVRRPSEKFGGPKKEAAVKHDFPKQQFSRF
jgi:hypothetical protein